MQNFRGLPLCQNNVNALYWMINLGSIVDTTDLNRYILSRSILEHLIVGRFETIWVLS
jgi:hypothetical protein